ncbi:MAG: 6-carboxytetrahydropterin synthase [Desulfurococcales archaeon]|nr:6-carboxytetrahydropterin synthase [Desulfurococcales archaeon]MEB3788765.1 6-carboxytetrahydropterin synthase [Desulfurococcales archaeon]
MLKYCVEKTASVAMRITKWGYGLHGHDLAIIACWDAQEVYDIEKLDRILTKIVEKIDHNALWEVIGGELIEDLLKYICSRLSEDTPKGLFLDKVSVRVQNKLITLRCDEKFSD